MTTREFLGSIIAERALRAKVDDRTPLSVLRGHLQTLDRYLPLMSASDQRRADAQMDRIAGLILAATDEDET